MRLGPIVGITIIVPNLEEAIEFYSSYLGIGATCETEPLVAERALAMGETRLVGAPSVFLCAGSASIQLIEVPTALPRLTAHGWTGFSLMSPGPDTIREFDRPGGECIACMPGDHTRILWVTLFCNDLPRAQAFYRGLGLLDGTAPNAPNLRGDQSLMFLPAEATVPPALRTGIHLVSFARSDASGRRLKGQDDPSARILSGAEGEGVELV
jgi:catechol 2,3-dioxygenase-like lactoylglutathione lyase family enzyme